MRIVYQIHFRWNPAQTLDLAHGPYHKITNGVLQLDLYENGRKVENSHSFTQMNFTMHWLPRYLGPSTINIKEDDWKGKYKKIIERCLHTVFHETNKNPQDKLEHTLIFKVYLEHDTTMGCIFKCEIDGTAGEKFHTNYNPKTGLNGTLPKTETLNEVRFINFLMNPLYQEIMFEYYRERG